MKGGKRGIIFILSTIIFMFSISLVLRHNSTIVNGVIVNGKVEKKVPIHAVEVEGKEVALTFDVNWAEKDYIYDILEILDKYNVKATFFIIGKWVNYTPENVEKLKAINEKGHDIGNHSYSHPDFANASEKKITEEIKKTEEIIEKAIGIKTPLFRFPSGSYSSKAVDTIEKLGYIPIQWDVDSVDWREDGAKIEYDRVSKKVKSGSIVLFHNNAKYTPENLEKLLKKLKEEGYDFKGLSEIIIKENNYVDENGIQHKK